MLKRVISAVIGLLILILVFAVNNMAVLNIAVTIIALIGISEFYNALKNKKTPLVTAYRKAKIKT